MSTEILFSGLSYSVRDRKFILCNLNCTIRPSSFVALLGENGSGKTTLLDLLMGFKAPAAGKVLVGGEEPHCDHWRQRERIAYLSEKVDVPGDWTVREFLNFNKFFYPHYSDKLERELLQEFVVDEGARLGNMSAGELKRVHVVGGLAIQPKLILVDEITAVLDIIGRRKFMRKLKELNAQTGCTVVLATNILEELENYATDLLLLRKGQMIGFQPTHDFMSGRPYRFTEAIADFLETQPLVVP